MLFEGHDLATVTAGELRKVRRRLQVIFQDPYSSLNPRMTVGQIIAEPLAVHGIVPDRAARAARVRELLGHAGLLPAMARRYPHELSGGQRQRVGIARALAMEPPSSSATSRSRRWTSPSRPRSSTCSRSSSAEFGLTYLFVAHDLSVVRHISDRVAVMYLGKIVEITDRKTLYESRSTRIPGRSCRRYRSPIRRWRRTERIVLRGEVPSPLNPPLGVCLPPPLPHRDRRSARESPSSARSGPINGRPASGCEARRVPAVSLEEVRDGH